MTNLHYDLTALREIRNGEDMLSYNTISCHDDQGREASFTVNAHGEGLFFWDKAQGCYRQTMGTCQFSIYGWSDNKARRELRSEWERIYETESFYE